MEGGAAAGVAVALGAAGAWGGGDFSGGMAVKAAGATLSGALRVIVLAHATSLAVLVGLIVLTHGAMPHGVGVLWAMSAGAVAALSLAAFYIALGRGQMGPAAAVSGLLAAAVPAVVSSLMEGAPGVVRLAGFAVAAVAIWAIAASDVEDPPGTMLLASAGGVGFGYYFVALRMANGLGTLAPIACARTASLTLCALLWVVLRKKSDARLGAGAMRWAMGIALLDTGGNLLYVTATRMGRLDVAAVLASLYPAGTILLAAWRLHERPTRKQMVGLGLAVAAVAMVTL